MSNLPLSLPEASKVDPAERDWVSSAEIEAQADLSYRQVDYWTRTGLLTPIGASITPGSGYRRRYPKAELDKAIALNALLHTGLELPWLRQHIDQILAEGKHANGPVTITYIPEK